MRVLLAADSCTMLVYHTIVAKEKLSKNWMRSRNPESFLNSRLICFVYINQRWQSFGSSSWRKVTSYGTFAAFMQTLSHYWTWNSELGIGNYFRLCGTLPKCMPDASHVCTTYSRTLRFGSEPHCPALLNFSTPIPQRFWRGCWMFIFSRIPPFEGGDRNQFYYFFRIRGFLLRFQAISKICC